LDSADPTIRHAARIAIEHQPAAQWHQRALQERRITAALTALLALARAGDKALIPATIDRLIEFSLRELDVGQTITLLHAYAICLAKAPDAVAAKKGSIIAQLDAVFPHSAGRWPHVSPLGSGANVQRELARLLAELGSPAVVEKTISSLLVSGAQEDQLHGLFTLRSVREGWTPSARRAYFQALNDGARFVSGEGMPKFLAHLREESLKTLSEAERVELADLLVPASGIDESGPLPSPRPVVKNWTLDDFTPLLADSARKADAARGAVVFRDALCARCHRVGARGPAVGPDLTHVAGRFSRRDLLESILTPSKVVADNYRNVQIRTTDGRLVIGRVAVEGDYRSEKLQISTDPLRPNVIVELKKQEIEEFRESETSPMPQGLMDSFRADEVLDLLEFLASGAIANAAGR
jgi:putative heme-binding domain-containing protein